MSVYDTQVVITDTRATVHFPGRKTAVFHIKQNDSGKITYQAAKGAVHQLIETQDKTSKTQEKASKTPQLILKFGDQSQYVFTQSPLAQHWHLSAIANKYQQAVTIERNSAGQIIALVDALNQKSLVHYNDQGLVESVQDPFGRKAEFEYTKNQLLSQLTDMGGFSAKLRYTAQGILTAISDAKGTTEFRIEEPDPLALTASGTLDRGTHSEYYPLDAASIGRNYRITITHPDDRQEEFYHNGYFYDGEVAESWHVAPKHYIGWIDENNNNFKTAPKSAYILFQKGLPKAELSRFSTQMAVHN